MPYRISMHVDIPDADVMAGGQPRATTKTARNAYDAMSDMQEAAGKFDADFLYDDIEWYAFEPDQDELTANSWTYADEELVRDMLDRYESSLRRDDGEFDLQIHLDEETDDTDQYERVKREFEKRVVERDREMRTSGTRDPVYRLLRAKVQALLDRDAPRACVLIEVDWVKVDGNDTKDKVVVLARDDLEGRYAVWTVGFTDTEPSSLNNGRYDMALTTASGEMDQRLWR